MCVCVFGGLYPALGCWCYELSDEAIIAVGKFVSALVSVDGWPECSDVHAFLGPPSMPVLRV